MKDYKLKQRNLRASHTLGWSYFFFPPDFTTLDEFYLTTDEKEILEIADAL
jgi:hypothetical protein